MHHNLYFKYSNAVQLRHAEISPNSETILWVVGRFWWRQSDRPISHDNPMAWRVTSNIHLGPVKGNHFHSVLDTWNKSSTTFIIKWNVSKHIRFMYSFVPRSFKSIALLNWTSIGRFNWHLTRNIGAKSYINRRGKLLNVK